MEKNGAELSIVSTSVTQGVEGAWEKQGVLCGYPSTCIGRREVGGASERDERTGGWYLGRIPYADR